MDFKVNSFKVILSLFLVFAAFVTQAQTQQFYGARVSNYEQATSLTEQFKKARVYALDAAAMQTFFKKRGNNIHFELTLGDDLSWPLTLTAHDIRGNDYELKVLEPTETVAYPKSDNIFYRGYSNDGRVALTVDKDLIYGFISEGQEEYFIEPLWYFEPAAPKNLYVVYDRKDVIEVPDRKCAAEELDHAMNQYQAEDNHGDDAQKVLACYEVTVALAADWSMRQKFGGVTGALNHILGVLNNVATNYDNEFTHQLVLVSGPTFVSNCSTCDPWTSSTNSSTLLGSFRSWGNGGGFGGDYDVAGLWTNRNLDGSTIGIAYVGGLCGSFRYHVCQDFTSNAANLRVLHAHELGHNFDADHDASGSPFIMAPAVNSSNAWSSASQSSINSFVQFRINQGTCFTSCGGGNPPPVADFSSNHTNPACEGDFIQFFDQSSNNPTSWQWSFPGGTPSSSTQENPLIRYNNTGTYNVTLTVSNAAGSNTLTRNAFVIVDEPPIADFSYSVNLNVVQFFNNSFNADTYFWSFGDGFTSTLPNPTHTYFNDGTYLVTLTVTNACGSDTYSNTVTVITPVIASFLATPNEGCSPLITQFINTSSSNATNFRWHFQGGTPSISFDRDPLVTYNSMGEFDVKLVAWNTNFSDSITLTDYILVYGDPMADFSYSINGYTALFNNLSQDYTTLLWEFGDGSTSTSPNPAHTYSQDGTYTVRLIVYNDCGSDTITQVITIANPPVANFTASPTAICAPYTVNFTNLSSSNATDFQWHFPGGTPEFSTAVSPTVTYTSKGFFDVTLTASNATGSDVETKFNYMDVNIDPTAAFTVDINGYSVDFVNLSVEATSWLWNFGDGSTSTLENPTHTYFQDGTYYVSLTAYNICGQSTHGFNITISNLPIADFSANVTSGCNPLTVLFENESSSNTSLWYWTFPGGNPGNSSDPDPTVVYQNPGSYDVILIVTNANGEDTLRRTNYITINTTPTTSFSAAVNLRDVIFTNNSSGANTSNWNFGDGNTSNQMHPTHTYSQDGVYQVTLTSGNGCGTTSQTQTITIVTPPVAGFSAANTNGCAPFNVNFVNESSSNTTTWQWTFEDGNPATSTEQNPVVTFDAPGVYDVTLVVSNAAGNSTYTRSGYIIVGTTPQTSFDVNIDLANVEFVNNTTGGDAFQWNFGDSNTSSEANPTHTYDLDGVYQITLTASNVCGNSVDVKNITIVTPPAAAYSIIQSAGCVPFSVNYSNQSSYNTATYLWSFPGGNPATSTEENPTVVYQNPGIYSSELIVSNPAGSDTFRMVDAIAVNTIPNAAFTAAVNLAEVIFTNQSTNALTYGWDFGDGEISSDENPAHQYTLDGIYTVTLTATNECGPETSTQTVTIVTPPTADFSANWTKGCAPFEVEYTDHSSYNAIGRLWEFAGGNPSTSTELNPVITYPAAGVYSVKLTVTNAAGQRELLLDNLIEVGTGPSAEFSADIDLGNVQFTNASSGATTYLWDFGDGNTSTEEHPTHIYSDGLYQVSLMVTNDCGVDTFSQTYAIATSIPIAFFDSDVRAGCAPFAVQFSNESSANATEILWQFPGGSPASSNDQNPLVTYASPGTYDVIIIASNILGNDTFIIADYIVVEDIPNADFGFDLTVTTVTFSNLSVRANAYEWLFGDGNTSNESEPDHTYPGNGTYAVQLIATNDCGTDTMTQDIIIAGAIPVPAFTSNLTKVCAPDVVQFTDQSGENPTAWLWHFEGGTPSTSTEQHPSVTYEVPGIYEVSLQVTNIFGTNSIIETAYIKVEEQPVADFGADITERTVQFTNNSSGSDQFQWDFGDGNASAEASPSHTYLSDGTYTVVLSITNACGTVTATQEIEIKTTGLDDLKFLDALNIFPNPNHGNFVLSASGKSKNTLKIRLLNNLGQRLMETEEAFHSGHLRREFDLQWLSTGLYILQIQSEDDLISRKISIE